MRSGPFADERELERLLGTGSMGQVFLARDEANRPVAVKILENDSPAVLGMFEDEVRILSRLKHPHLVRVLGFSRAPRPRYWMEYVDGRPLLAAARGVSADQVLAWFQECLDA